MATVPSNHSNSTDDLATLRTLNEAELARLVPVIVYLAVLSVSGAAGNAIVFHVYRTKYRYSNSKSFVLCLCLIDLFSCIVAMPLEILTVLDQYTFEDIWLCKTSRFSNYFTAMSSSWLIAIIAVERYRKVCQPFKWQISTKAGTYLCIFSVVCGAAASVPAIFIFGQKSYAVRDYGIVGIECSTDDSMVGKTLPTFHLYLTSGLFAIAVILIVIVYVIIGYTILKHEKTMFKEFRFRKDYSPGPVSFCQSQDIDSNIPSRRQSEEIQTQYIKDDINNDHNNTESNTASKIHTIAINAKDSPCLSLKTLAVSKVDVSSKTSLYPNLQAANGTESNYRSLQNNSNSTAVVVSNGENGKNWRNKSQVTRIISRQTSTRKTALLMFMVSIAFVLSYTPHLLLMLCRLIKTGFVENMSDHGRAAYKFFLRSYFLNYAINPLIYCLCGTKFRNHCKEFICRKCTRK